MVYYTNWRELLFDGRSVEKETSSKASDAAARERNDLKKRKRQGGYASFGQLSPLTAITRNLCQKIVMVRSAWIGQLNRSPNGDTVVTQKRVELGALRNPRVFIGCPPGIRTPIC